MQPVTLFYRPRRSSEPTRGENHNTRHNARPGNGPGVSFMDAPGFLSREAALAASFLQESPYFQIRLAVNGANHDYIYNHTPGPAWVKGTNADLGLYNWGPNELLTFDGGLSLWQYLDYQARHGGREIDLKSDLAGSQQLVQELIDKTGILPEHAWNFVTNLDRLARETGSTTILRPSLENIQTSIGTPTWVWVAGALGALVALRYVLGGNNAR